MLDPMSYFSFQPVLHDWCNKGREVDDGILVVESWLISATEYIAIDFGPEFKISIGLDNDVIIIMLLGFLMCTFTASCYSARLSWAHRWLVVSNNPVRG